MPLPITAIFAGLLALWLIFLQFKVVGFRRSRRVLLGHGNDELGERLVRAHGNATENIPIFLILLGLAEGLGTPAWIIGFLGALFLLGRVVHGIHFFKQRQGITMRFYGMLMSLASIGLAALGAIGHGLSGL
jgi:uncharacterized membrane protein YecN with MAPEG domain